ncbi:MAG: MoaD/ThiS family protein [Anaerolineales bacterium]|nr:MoaD/ThiS family protein [Anaerolineales bacterium]
MLKINLYATLRALVGKKTVEIEAPEGITAQEVVEVVVQHYPALRQELLDAEGRFHSHLKFLINGRDASYLENGMSTVIQPEDKIDIFPPVGGG